MTSYEILDLLYSDLRHKFKDGNIIFTRKYTVGRQRIRIHCLRDEKKPDTIECLDFLKKIQENYGYCSQWTPFYFSHFPTHHNIVIYQFLCENEEEVRMYELFSRLVISLRKTCAFRKNTILQKNNFFIIWVKI